MIIVVVFMIQKRVSAPPAGHRRGLGQFTAIEHEPARFFQGRFMTGPRRAGAWSRSRCRAGKCAICTHTWGYYILNWDMQANSFDGNEGWGHIGPMGGRKQGVDKALAGYLD